MIRICLNVKSQWTKQIEVFSQGTEDSKNLRCETLYIGNYEYVNISSFAVLLGIKLRLEEDRSLNKNDPLYSFKFIQSKAQNWYNMLSSFSYNFKSNIANFCIFVISNNESFISQNLKTVGPLGGRFDFFSPSGYDIQSDFDYRTSKIKFYSVRALKCYLNDKNLMHGQVMATISKFSSQIVETYFI